MVTNTEKAGLVANMLANNNQSSANNYGIRLAGTSKRCWVYYNNFQDEQQQPTQTMAILEEPSAGGNLIRFNLSRPKSKASGQGTIDNDNQ